MIVRTLQVQVAPDRIEPILEAYREDVRPIHERARGLRQHLVLVDREGGVIRFIGLWDGAEDVERIAAELEPARARLWERFDEAPVLEIHEAVDVLR